MWGPTQKLGPIGSTVLTVIGYKHQDKIIVFYLLESIKSKIYVMFHDD